MRFFIIRMMIAGAFVASQVYLFLRIRRAVGSMHRPDRFKSMAILLAGAGIVLLFIANWYITFRRIPWQNPSPGAQILLLYPPAIWSFGSVLSALILFLSSIIGRLIRSIARFKRTYSIRAGSAAGVSRRQFLKAGVFGIAALPYVVSSYGASYTLRSCKVNELAIPFGCRMRVVQLSDIHAGLYMTQKQIRHYIDRVIALQPDMFLLTGDFISNSMSFLPECLEEMARVRTRYGTFASLGNHENWYGRPHEIEAVFRNFGIPLLNNANQVIRTGGGLMAVAAIDDLLTGHPDLDAAMAGLSDRMPTILLSHRPEIFPEAAARGIPLTLSGHFHGGQITLRLPGVAISLAHIVTPYPEGLYRIKASHLYVSKGVGTTFIPIRLNASPEITLFNLT